LHWHDLRHGAPAGLGADVDICIMQLMLGHSDIKAMQRHLNIIKEELRKTLTGAWERRLGGGLGIGTSPLRTTTAFA
jgi:site-specific recombinase XerD